MTTDDAREWTCDACCEPHTESVEPLSPDARGRPRVGVRCERSGEVPVDPHRLRQERFDLGAVARWLSQAIGSSGEPSEIVANHLWQIGLTVVGTQPVAAFVARGLDGDGLAAAQHPTLLAIPKRLVFTVGDAPSPSAWGATPPTHIVPLPACLAVVDGELELVDAVLGMYAAVDRRTRASTQLRIVTVPAGTRWQDLQITVEERSLLVTGTGIRASRSIPEIGCENRTRGHAIGDGRWDLLRVIARRRGRLRLTDADLTAVDRRSPNALAKKVGRLRDVLTTLIPVVAGDPLPWDPATNQYVAACAMRSADGPLIPLPDGVGWDAITLTWMPDRHLRVAWERTQRRGTLRYDEDGDAVPDTAIDRSSTGSVIALLDLGLEDSQGRLTRAGTALERLCAEGGSIEADGADRGVLELRQRLQQVFGLTADPCEPWTPARKRWISIFTAERG